MAQRADDSEGGKKNCNRLEEHTFCVIALARKLVYQQLRSAGPQHSALSSDFASSAEPSPIAPGTGPSTSTPKPSTKEPFPHEVGRIKSHPYHADTGPHRGPKPIYTIAEGDWVKSAGLEAYGHLMKVVDVPEVHKMVKDGLWDQVRNRVLDT
ncbi:hypothetical protein K488DRAFT_69988 [Vararia minispora EC-137]|uniref:Uncharacterized protein n=1 Tax=Vararia minispora EC-137 TaxID=1314806 RepID=A0ACB8QNP0_9AGAM|nr:hypothetical protein K488DRAFT_69988 [Vararia minispora EC-137]